MGEKLESLDETTRNLAKDIDEKTAIDMVPMR